MLIHHEAKGARKNGGRGSRGGEEARRQKTDENIWLRTEKKGKQQENKGGKRGLGGIRLIKTLRGISGEGRKRKIRGKERTEN